MARLTNYSAQSFFTNFTPAGTIAAGNAVGFDGNVAAANARLLGVAIEDTGTAAGDDTISSALYFGEADVVANGAISAGDYIKVGASGKFLSAGSTFDNKVVGTAKTAASGDGKTFTAFIGLF